MTWVVFWAYLGGIKLIYTSTYIYMHNQKTKIYIYMATVNTLTHNATGGWDVELNLRSMAIFSASNFVALTRMAGGAP